MNYVSFIKEKPMTLIGDKGEGVSVFVVTIKEPLGHDEYI